MSYIRLFFRQGKEAAIQAKSIVISYVPATVKSSRCPFLRGVDIFVSSNLRAGVWLSAPKVEMAFRRRLSDCHIWFPMTSDPFMAPQDGSCQDDRGSDEKTGRVPQWPG